MPAQHRRTYGAISEMALAISFTVVPFIAYLLTGNSNAFRYLALPGGLAITVVPVLVYFVIPESPRWHFRRGHTQAADLVNRIISRSGNRVPQLTVEALGGTEQAARDQLPLIGHCSPGASGVGPRSAFSAVSAPGPPIF